MTTNNHPLLHDAGAAIGVVQLSGLGNDALLAAVLNKDDGSANLGSHTTFGKMAFLQILLGLCHGNGVESLLILLDIEVSP